MARLAHAAEEEFGVGGGFAEVAEDGFEGVADGKGGEVFADFDDFAELVGVVEAVVVAGAGLGDVDGGVDAALGEFAVEFHLHVAGAFEFLEDDVVHAAFGFDEGGGKDGERAAFFAVARGAEEFAGFGERGGADAAGTDGAALHGGVMASGEAGEAVQQKDDIFAAFDEAFGAFDDHVGDLGVTAWCLVEGGGEHAAADGFLEVGDFLGTLVEQEDDQFGFWVVGADGLGDLFEEDGFAAARRGDDEAALAFAEGGDEIEDADGEKLGATAIEMEALVWELGGEFVELGAGLKVGGGDAFDFENFGGGEVFAFFARAAQADFDTLAGADAVVAEEVVVDVDVVGAGAEAFFGVAEQGEGVFGGFDDAIADETDAFGGVEAEEFVDELAFRDAGLDPRGDGGRDVLQLGEWFLAKDVDVDGRGQGDDRWGGRSGGRSMGVLRGLGGGGFRGLDFFGGSHGKLVEIAADLGEERALGSFVPENDVGAAKFFVERELGGQDGLDGRFVKSVAGADAAHLGLVRGGDEEDRSLAEIEVFFEEQRHIGHKQTRTTLAGALAAGKTFLADARVEDGFKFGAGVGFPKDEGAKGITVDFACGIEGVVAEGVADLGGHDGIGIEQGADGGVGIEDNAAGPHCEDGTADCGFAIGHAAGKAEDVHGRDDGGVVWAMQGGTSGRKHVLWRGISAWRSLHVGRTGDGIHMMKTQYLLLLACAPQLIALPIALPEAEPGPFAPVPAKIAGPEAPAKPMEPEPPTLDGCKNVPAILKELGVTLTDAQRTRLATERFLLIPVEATSVGEKLPADEDEMEWSFRSDEMISAFFQLGGFDDPTFREPHHARLINPDIVLQAWHRGFARALEHIEERRLHEILTTFLEGTLQNTRELRAAAADDEALAARLAWMESRFAAPWVVLGPPAPPFVEPWEENKPPAPPPYAEAVSARLAAAMAGLPDDAAAALKAEVEAVLQADGMSPSPLFGKYSANRPADYTQFKPRSHYTKSDTLGGYFRAMMFLGRTGYNFEHSDAFGDAALAALAMARTTSKGTVPLEAWKQIMEISGFFAGQSDDITYTEFRAWIEATLGITALDPATAIAEETTAKLAANLTSLRPPQIVSSVHLDQDTSPDAGPREFRVFGQRFTWDARVLDRFTRESPVAMPSLPTALMIPAAFGDPYAEKHVREFLAGNPVHTANFGERLPQVRGELAAVSDEGWFTSMAAKQLHVISMLARPRGETFPAFMRTEAFAAKNLESQLGSFTQLKHDTVLYAKQVYAEAGEGGLDDKLPPVVKGLVQPDLPFWREIERLTRFAADGFARHKLFPDADEEFSRFQIFAAQMTTLRKLAEKQAAGLDLNDDEWETIRTIDFHPMTLPFTPYDEPNPGDGKNALVTDILTDGASGQILFQALGRPFVMLALVGGRDGERMVAGVAYRHHEFAAPIAGGRLTNDEWRARIYRTDPEPIPRAPWQVPVP